MNPALIRHLQTLGLERAPFPPTPDAAAWFQTSQLESELIEAAHCLRTRAGFVLLTGEIGTGKSTFLRRLLLALDGDGVVTSMVFNTFLQGPDLLAAVLRDFGLEAKGNPAADIETLNRFLVQQWQAQATCVLMIDDAQNLSLESLELLRLLTNLETGQEKLLQIVLAGQPELRRNLEQPGIRQLTSRICKHVQLDVLGPDEVLRYVQYRLAAAGNPSPGIQLQADAAQVLHRVSGGNPRRIHQIMDRCLYGLYRLPPEQRVIDSLLVRTASAEAGAQPLRPRHPRSLLAASIAAGVMLGVSVLALALRSGDSHAETLVTSTVAATSPSTTTWERCLQALDTHSPQLHIVSEEWLARLPSHEHLCLRRTDEGWQAAWKSRLRVEDFLATGDARTPLFAVQTLLREQGLYLGAIDGRYGPRMRAAIEQFQQRNGLTNSGMPDPATLFLFDTLLAASATSSSLTSETQHHGHG